VLTALFFSSHVVAENLQSRQVKSVEKRLTTGPQLANDDVLLEIHSSAVLAGQQAQSKILTARPQSSTVNTQFWVYDAWVTFFDDPDGDGYANHFSVEFDADTEFNRAQVYARLYLAKDQVFKEYHRTSNFNIFADSDTDSVVVESELLSGFPSADYEILIELYDGQSDQLVAVYDGNEDTDLYLVSIESNEYESIYAEPQVVVVTQSGGSGGWLLLWLLPWVVRKLGA
jgi:hypothetical protein